MFLNDIERIFHANASGWKLFQIVWRVYAFSRCSMNVLITKPNYRHRSFARVWSMPHNEAQLSRWWGSTVCLEFSSSSEFNDVHRNIRESCTSVLSLASDSKSRSSFNICTQRSFLGIFIIRTRWRKEHNARKCVFFSEKNARRSNN